MSFHHSTLSLTLVSAMTFSVSSPAKTLWSTNSISYLKNTANFKVLTNDSINVFTLEHASGHNWGDVFVFADRVDAKADNNAVSHKETYSEVSARLSLKHALGIDLTNEFVKDTFIASTWEFSSISKPNFSRGFDNYLLGIGAAWNIKGFQYINTNLYLANNELTDDDIQLTVNWRYPLLEGKHRIIFDGYFDWSSAANDHAADFHLNPQLRVDIGRYFNKPNTVEAGIEYSYWHNKFGIRGIGDESVISAMVKVYL